MVVLFHCETNGFLSSLPFVRNSFLFVDFFFVLSGFVIGLRYGRGLIGGASLVDFLWGRFARVYPLHLAMLAVFLIVELILAAVGSAASSRHAFEGGHSVEAFVRSLLFLQIAFGSASVWNVPSWSVAAEWWIYLMFALIARFRGRWLVPISVVTAILAPIYLGLRGEQYLNVMAGGALARALAGFSVGLLGWHCIDRIEAVRLPAMVDAGLEIAVSITVVAFVSLAGQGWPSLAAPLFFLPAVLIFARERGPVTAMLRWSPLGKLGLWSYSIYLIHFFLLYRLFNTLGAIGRITGLDLLDVEADGKSVGGSALFGDAVSLLFLGAVIVVARLSYRHIEEPARLFLRDRVRLPRLAFAAAP